MDPKRRVVNYALLGLVGTGGYVTTGWVFKSLEPPLKAQLNAATLIDTSTLKLNEISFLSWRKKPLFVLKQDSNLPIDRKRSFQIGSYFYTIMIGICTHLGCIPKYEASLQRFVCPCHNGIFSLHGNPISGPVTKPLEIPPFLVEKDTILVGQAGEIYKKLVGIKK
jgi:ubiquinol-cytochrome c reductase iron-sulfur subunit